MASKEDLIDRYYNNTLREFRFTLQEASEGVLILYHAPDGWQDAETTYSRHKTYGSVLRNTSTNELTFYKEGKQFIQNVYENSGIDAWIKFTVERLDKSTNTYVSYPSANKIDLSTYVVDEVSVSVQLIDTQFKEKALNRDTTEVDIIKTTSIEGLEVAAFPLNTVNMPDTSIDLQDTVTIGFPAPQSGTNFVVTLTSVTSADFTEMQVPTTSTINVKTSAFFKESIRPRILRLQGTIEYDARDVNALRYDIVHIDSSNNLVFSWEIFNETYSPTSSQELDEFDLDLYVTLDIGDSLLLQCTFNGNTARTMNEFTVSETYTGNRATTVTAYPYYEAFLRVLQLITDSENPFYSEFFGRTDTPLTTYAADGNVGFLTKGIFFRKANNISNTIPLKLKELFDSLSGVFRLGLGYEKIGGVDKIRVEELEYFFDSTVVVDISDRVRNEDIEKQVIPDMFYKSCEAGYNKFEYEKNAGLFEFNTKSSWTTVIKSVFNDFKKVSKFRADGQGIRLLLNAPYETDYDSSEDVKGDDDIFMIDAFRDGGSFKARTNEDFTLVTGSVYADSSYNILYSPARCLRAWGQDIRAGLVKALNTVLRWQSTEKNTTLASQTTSESALIYENEDILINDLNANRWYNEKYIVQVPLTVTELKAIDAAPNGLIKLSTTKYGWILEMKTKNKDGMAEFELLRCDLNNVTPS